MAPTDAAFLVGTDLVEFDRRDLPIYAMPDSPWAEAAREVAFHGAALDRLFGEPGEVFVAGITAPEIATAPMAPVVGDPLVELSGLTEGLTLPALEHETAHLQDAPHLPEMATVYDFANSGPQLHDLWTFDSHT